MYDGTEGRIKTLKDYKENRYGLTIYLANKIFSALRHEKKITDEEKDQVLKFFRGSNCIEFYRLWERVFTFFLVNDQPTAYVDFYLHAAEQIDKINSSTSLIVSGTKVNYSNVKETLIEYLDCAHELVLSLNPSFIEKTQTVSRNFEFQINKLGKSLFTFLFSDFEPTKKKSFWVRRFRETNMVRHQYIVQPLLSYTSGSKNSWTNLVSLKLDFAKLNLDVGLKENSPRPVKFWECCLAVAFEEISNFKLDKRERDGDYVITNILGITAKRKNPEPSNQGKNGNSYGFYLEKAFELYKEINQNHIPSYLLNEKKYKDQFFTFNTNKLEFDKWPELKVQEINVNSNKTNNLKEPRISFANTKVDEKSILKSLRGEPDLSIGRYRKLAGILKKARKEDSDILLFPESFIPLNLLSSLVRYSAKNQVLTITGLEHLTVCGVAFNFVVTILPTEVNGIKDAVVVFRLKNHYSHAEELLIHGNHLIVPKPRPYRYDLFNWRNVYFSNYYCFELTNASHRSIFKGKIDLLIGIEYNRDTPYFANIVETTSRDLHVYVAQVNTSQFGDTRLSQPVESARKDLLRLKGGINDTVLVAKIDIKRLREFQRKKFPLTNANKEFKPLPPDFLLEDVLKRIRNENILDEREEE